MENNNLNEAHSASQKARILRYMEAGHCITPIEALEMFDCFRLGARIADLKADGHTIRSSRVQDPVTGKYYASYCLI